MFAENEVACIVCCRSRAGDGRCLTGRLALGAALPEAGVFPDAEENGGVGDQ